MTRHDALTEGIDRVARAMTAGAPRADFADRVMAPIYGRPRRDFVARVMAALDAAPVPAVPRRAARRYAPALAACLGLGVLAALWLPSRVDLPPASSPAQAPPEQVRPHVTSTAESPELPQAPRRAAPARVPRQRAATVARHLATGMPTGAGTPPLYKIPALGEIDGIAVRPLVPASPAVSPLERPAPLIVSELRFEKEKS